MPTLELSSNVRKQHLVECLTNAHPVGEWLEEASFSEKGNILSLIGQNFISKNVSKIWIVKNNFLEAMYLLKKAELSCRFGRVNEKLLFHVTREDAVDSIVSENFDWRRVKRSKFGLGISFSDDILYCHKFANFNIGHERAIIVTKVMICRYKESCPDQLVPPTEFDTTVGNRKKVFVKYSDNEFLPLFVVCYNVSHVQPTDILEEYSKSVQSHVLEGVNKYMQNQRFPKPIHSKAQRRNIPKRLNSSVTPKPFHHQRPELRKSIRQNSVQPPHNVVNPISKTSRPNFRAETMGMDHIVIDRTQNMRGISHSRALNMNMHKNPTRRNVLAQQNNSEEEGKPGCCSSLMTSCLKVVAFLCCGIIPPPPERSGTK